MAYCHWPFFMHASNPPYPHRHAGNALVIGSAPCALADFAAARVIYPDAGTFAVNEAAGLFHVEHLVTQHPENMPRYRWQQESAFGPGAVCHAVKDPGRKDVMVPIPGVDHWWFGCRSSATSAWAAVNVARAMGYDGDIVLCGCPMTGGDGYALETSLGGRDDPRLGFSPAGSSLIIQHQKALMDEARTASRVYSMSGYSKAVLGAPSQLEP